MSPQVDRREFILDGERERKYEGETSKPSPPWGFFLVLAAIVVVAVVYSVTILSIGSAERSPEIVFGAMAACFTVIGTLVGTYFGVKAGLDGQDKLRQALSRDANEFRQRPPGAEERNGDGKDRAQRAEDEHVERTWHGGSA